MEKLPTVNLDTEKGGLINRNEEMIEMGSQGKDQYGFDIEGGVVNNGSNQLSNSNGNKNGAVSGEISYNNPKEVKVHIEENPTIINGNAGSNKVESGDQGNRI